MEEKEVSSEDDWKYTFSKLAKYDLEGIENEYEIVEKQVAGYAPEVTGHDLSNTRSEKTKLEIIKGWLDDNSKDRPDEIEVKLYRQIAGGERQAVETYKLKAEKDWRLLVEDLPAFNSEGRAYTYTIEEEPIEGYESTINGFIIGNLRVGKTEVTGYKKWTGGPSSKPTIELQLYRNGEKFGEPVELKDGEGEYTWKGLEKYDGDGVEYKYTIDEVNVPSRYTRTISEDGLTITNRYRPPVYPPTRPVDPDPEDPEELLVPIIPNPPAKGTVTVDPEGNWEYIPNPGETGEDSFEIVYPDGTEELITINLDDLPLGTVGIENGKTVLPKTGLVSNLGFYIIGLLLISLGFRIRKKK